MRGKWNENKGKKKGSILGKKFESFYVCFVLRADDAWDIQWSCRPWQQCSRSPPTIPGKSSGSKYRRPPGYRLVHLQAFPGTGCSRYRLFQVQSVPGTICSRYRLFHVQTVPGIDCSRYRPLQVVPRYWLIHVQAVPLTGFSRHRLFQVQADPGTICSSCRLLQVEFCVTKWRVICLTVLTLFQTIDWEFMICWIDKVDSFLTKYHSNYWLRVICWIVKLTFLIRKFTRNQVDNKKKIIQTDSTLKVLFVKHFLKLIVVLTQVWGSDEVADGAAGKGHK